MVPPNLHHERTAFQILFLFLIACCPCFAWAGAFNAGLGLAFADARNLEGFDGGWDFQFGYEAKGTKYWSLGAQLHLIKGWTSEGDVEADSDMSFGSTAVYFTARPTARWLQLKAGIANADYGSFPDIHERLLTAISGHW